MKAFLPLLVALVFLLPAVAGQAYVARVDLYGVGINNTYDYYEPIDIKYIFNIPNSGGDLVSDWFRVDRWNTTLGAWQSYRNYEITNYANLSWYERSFGIYIGDTLDLTDNYSPTAAFRAGVWSWNDTASAYLAHFLQVFYIHRPAVEFRTNQEAYKYGSFVKFQFEAANWRYWRDYYHETMNYLHSDNQELVCEMVITSYPTMYELVPQQQFSLYNNTRVAEFRDVLGNFEFTIPYPGSLGFDANLTIYAFVKEAGTSEVTRDVLYSENITLVSKAIGGVIADESAIFFGVNPRFATMLMAIGGVCVVTLFAGSIMQFSGAGYAVLFIASIWIVTAMGWFDTWYALFLSVIAVGSIFFVSEGVGGVAGEV